MQTIVYDKLVRDKIPDIIKASGRSCEIEKLSEKKYREMIDKKLTEELNEYYKDHNIEELADLIEVIYAAVEAYGFTISELEKVRLEKATKNGAFNNRILLKAVYE